MKVFLVAAVAAIVLAYGAFFVLDEGWQATSADAFKTTGVRLGDPGNNLVGADWPNAGAAAEDS
jgi:hypothetical protein